MYFRIQTDKTNHSRQVYGFMDWLSDVGGVFEVLSMTFLFIFGGFLRYNFVVSSIQSLYSPLTFGDSKLRAVSMKVLSNLKKEV